MVEVQLRVCGNTVETPIWRGRKGGGLADRRCQEHARQGPQMAVNLVECGKRTGTRQKVMGRYIREHHSSTLVLQCYHNYHNTIIPILFYTITTLELVLKDSPLHTLHHSLTLFTLCYVL